MNPLRILIADDHPALRAGIIAMLATEPDLVIVGAVGDGRAAVEQASALQPDVLLLDIDLPLLNGIEVTRQLRALVPATAILILSGHADPLLVQGVIVQGAAGYLTKDEPPERICAAIRAVATGERGWLSRPIAAILMQLQQTAPAQVVTTVQAARLTPREHAVLRLLAQGRSNAQIAVTLEIGSGTVKNHTINIYMKLGVHTRAEAVAWVLRHDPSVAS